MITVTIDYRGAYITAFSITGHAGHKPAGEDIYCAGVSAVAQTSLLGLLKHMQTPPDYQVIEGDDSLMQCQLPGDISEADQTAAQVILTTMELGLRAMQEAYPQYIQVKIRR